MNEVILALGEIINRKVTEESYEALAFAQSLHKYYNMPVKILFAGHAITGAAESFARETGSDVIITENRKLECYCQESYRQVINHIIEHENVRFTCIPHNSRGMDFAPALAVDCDTSIITSIEKLITHNNKLHAIRSSWFGKVQQLVALPEANTILTFFPGSFPYRNNKDTKGSAAFFHSEVSLEQTLSVTHKKLESVKGDLRHARTIIAAGNGIKSEEVMKLVEKFAHCFPRSAVAGSRIACDRGFVSYDRQVGMTGKKVSPDLYVACGISGSMQHIMGMKNSGYIIAVNHDPGAPIGLYADVFVVADIEDFIDAFLRLLAPS